MKTGFVIVNYNDFETTNILLNNIKEYNIIDEIVVVDNCSTDRSYEELSKVKDIERLKVIKANINRGFSGGLNLGCKYLIEKYKECNIFLSNADIIISEEKSLVKLLSLLNNENVVVGPTILEKKGKSRGWKIPTPTQEIITNLPILNNKIEKQLRYKEEYYKGEYSTVDTVSGCFFLISSEHLKNINYFDENVFLYYEENIFGIKTKNLSKKIVVANNIEVIHNHSVSIDKSIKRINKVNIQKKSQYYFEKKYNKANIIQLGLLKITKGIGRILLSIKYSLRL